MDSLPALRPAERDLERARESLTWFRYRHITGRKPLLGAVHRTRRRHQKISGAAERWVGEAGGAKRRADQHVGAPAAIVEAVDGEDVRHLHQLVHVAAEREWLELEGVWIRVIRTGTGAPAERDWRTVARDLDAVEVGHEAIVVLELHLEARDLTHIAHAEWYAHVDARALVVHLPFDVEIDRAVIAAAALVADPGRPARPRAVVESARRPTRAIAAAGWAPARCNWRRGR